MRIGVLGMATGWALRLGVVSASAVELEVVTADGLIVQGALAHWDMNAGLRLRVSGAEQVVPPDQVYRVIPVGRLNGGADGLDGPRVYLADGQIVGGRMIEFDGRSAVLECARLGRMTIGSELLRGAFWCEGGSGSADTAQLRFEDLMGEVENKTDALLIVGEDGVQSIPGILEWLDESDGRFRYDGESVAFRRSRACGVVLAETTAPDEVGTEQLRLADGTRLTGRIHAVNEEKLMLKATVGPEVQIPWSDVLEVRRNDAIVFLSELDPVSYDFEPLLNTEWGWCRDRNVTGGPMRIVGRSYDRGIGVHAQCRLTFDLNGMYRTFAATVGIDDAVRPRGSAIFAVAVDGRTVWESGPVTGRDSARVVSLSVDDVKLLTLMVQFGDDLDVADHADWGDARLIRK